MKECLWCCEKIKKNAIKCRYWCLFDVAIVLQIVHLSLLRRKFQPLTRPKAAGDLSVINYMYLLVLSLITRITCACVRFKR